jgi:hypothetical protein
MHGQKTSNCPMGAQTGQTPRVNEVGLVILKNLQSCIAEGIHGIWYLHF